MARLFLVFPALFALIAQTAAFPAEVETRDDLVYRCANGVDVCPNAKYTCCGPILEGVGGTCRILAPGEVVRLLDGVYLGTGGDDIGQIHMYGEMVEVLSINTLLP